MIYIEPGKLWEKFEANKTSLAGHYLTCAEDDAIRIIMTEEEGALCLMADDMETEQTHCELIDSEEEAVSIYSEMLTWISAEEDAVEEDVVESDDYMEPILAAAYAFIGVLADETPTKLGLVKADLEDAAYQMAWYLKGRHDIESLLA